MKSNAQKLDSKKRAAFLSQDGLLIHENATHCHNEGSLSPEISYRAN